MKPANHAGVATAIAPLVAWILIQLITLMLAAFRVPLSARFPQPAERLALHEMLIAQVVFAGMLFPWVLRSRGAAITIIFTSWPFAMLAGVLADAEVAQILFCAGYVSGWLIALALLAGAMRESPRAQLIAIALVNCATLGGPIVWYLVAESGHGISEILTASPVVGALKLLAGPVLVAWIWLTVYVAVGGIALSIARRK
jgi:hypothetical protein